MDPEFQRLVDAAAEVAATGRWDAVNERIKNLAASPGPDNAWHVITTSSLVCGDGHGEDTRIRTHAGANRSTLRRIVG